ncbi:hypothetical protein [Halorussus pelagicus]|uniref:hypothetical protein n=1 Tax=Halorussus pelagicus TaxID=2505977 RepID=UPI000FFB34A8|nr:hypothetical protein [Halorussus pelagicus]
MNTAAVLVAGLERRRHGRRRVHDERRRNRERDDRTLSPHAFVASGLSDTLTLGTAGALLVGMLGLPVGEMRERRRE